VGIRNVSNTPKYIFTDGVARPAKNINAYLLDSADIYITPRSNSISDLPEMNFGNMANDAGNLFLSPDERNNLLRKNSQSGQFIKKLIGSLEFIRGVNKYCL